MEEFKAYKQDLASFEKRKLQTKMGESHVLMQVMSTSIHRVGKGCGAQGDDTGDDCLYPENGPQAVGRTPKQESSPTENPRCCGPALKEKPTKPSQTKT